MPKKIAILYIGTGRYTVFWEEFYRTMERYFLPGHEKTYFFFTDDETISVGKNVIKVPQENLGWPNNTLMRFEMFLKIESRLKNFDYIYFLNGNMVACAPIGEEVFPTNEQKIMVTRHPGYYNQGRASFTYDTNPQSTAYIPADKGEIYVMGGFNGGTAAGFLGMCRTLDANIKKDLEQGIVAAWHDESHLNHYILDKNPLILSSAYGIPEGYKISYGLFKFPTLMLIRDKNNPKYGGTDWLRGITDKKIGFIGAVPYYLQPIKNIFKIAVKAFISPFLFLTGALKPVKTVTVMEGLGNQMFIYAFGQALMRSQNNKVVYDITEYAQCFRPYRLGHFHTKVPVGLYGFFAQLVIKLRTFGILGKAAAKIGNFCLKAFRKILKFCGVKRFAAPVYKETSSEDLSCLKLQASIIYKVFVQNEKYFLHLRPQLLQDFHLKVPLSPATKGMLAKIKEKPQSVSLHVRRGDYLVPHTNAIHGTCSLDYYQKAVGVITSKVENPHFFLFSDDIPWVKENLKMDHPYTVVDINGENEGHFDLELMKHCKHNIIANSSFSWWGAWLNENPQKIVIAPSRWTLKDIPYLDNVIPKEWIKIEG